MRSAFVTLAFVAAACGDRAPLPAASTADGGADSAIAIQSSPCDVKDVTGTIPGVKISIHGDECIIPYGTGATFTYTVTTDASVPSISIQASGGCGSCRTFGDDPMTLTGWVISGDANGQHQQYCLCDTGCCAPDPSDTGNQEAGYFPVPVASGPNDRAGARRGRERDRLRDVHYDVIVSFYGGPTGSVTAKLPIEIR